MKTNFFVLFLLFAVCFGGCGRLATIPECIFQSSVIISAEGSKGTGVVIYTNKIGDLEETYILTAKHIVESEKIIPLFTNKDFDKALRLLTLYPKKYNVSYDIVGKNMVLVEKISSHFCKIIVENVENGVSKNREILASVKNISEKRDLAVLSFVSKKTLLLPAKTREKNICIEGNDLWACGFSVSDLTLTKGVLGRKIFTNTTRGLYTGGVMEGCSGGGIFDKDGYLIGIIVNVQGRLSTGPAWHLCGFEFINKKEIEDISKLNL